MAENGSAAGSGADDVGTFHEGTARVEWEAWRRLCFELRKRGAVTTDELSHSTTSLEHPGCRLLEQIRQWGAALAALKVEVNRG